MKLSENFQLKEFVDSQTAERLKIDNRPDWEAVITKGTKETCGVKDFSESGKGGLKIVFKDKDSKPIAFIWMRGSGTEPVFRIMCDVKGDKPDMEKALLEWETELIKKADK